MVLRECGVDFFYIEKCFLSHYFSGLNCMLSINLAKSKCSSFLSVVIVIIIIHVSFIFIRTIMYVLPKLHCGD